MSWRREKPAGWSAFGLRQREKDIIDTQANKEPFPSLPSDVNLGTLSRNNHLYVKPFTSVIQPSVGYPAHVGNKNKSKPSKVGSSANPESYNTPSKNKFGLVFRQLKELYTWADDSLIEDVMAAAGNDFDKASSFLKAMVFEDSLEKNNNNKVIENGSDTIETVKNDVHGRQDVSEGKISESLNTCSALDLCAGDNYKNLRDEFDLLAERLLDGCMDINGTHDKLTSVPIEPEWEEDDVYLSCRKDAIKMMRDAARHSKAATNSYLRGDHISAQHFSLKAHEEWVAAERLNAKAASEILSTRNENNGIWRLDLHGLHASEANQALQQHLHMIETQVFFKGNSIRTKAEVSQASSLDNGERSDKMTIIGQNPKWLEVITGIGNHSRGGAALPMAVRTFLADNGYRFDESRPGVIMVRPKVRHT